MTEKRKNDARSGWRAFLIGFVLGGLVILGAVSVVMGTNGSNSSSSVIETQQDLPLTATQLIRDATQMAQFTPAADLDPLLMTATAIIQQATQQAGG